MRENLLVLPCCTHISPCTLVLVFFIFRLLLWEHSVTLPCWSSDRTFSNSDNTAGILTGRATYSRLHKSVYLVPVVITDDDYPMQSSTGTLTVRVCTCDHEGNMELCKPEALSSSPGLSTGALIAILLCAIILLCKYDWTCKLMCILYLYIIVVPYHTILVLPQSGGLRNLQWLCLQEHSVISFNQNTEIESRANKNTYSFGADTILFPGDTVHCP